MPRYSALLIFFFILNLAHGQQFKISGIIVNEKKAPLQNVTIQVDAQKVRTNKNGAFGIQLSQGTYEFKFQHLGYKTITQSVNVNKNDTLNITFLDNQIDIEEVFITAKESKSLQTSSVITKEAMQLLQPSSFADLLELLPGGRAQDPSLTSFNAIKLREVNLEDKTMTLDKYDMSSLGVSFYLDGAPINTNSDLQSVQGYTTSTLNKDVSNTNRGLDLRSLGTDDIEKVTIIRGIPSVEYGDMTSGMVLIDRKKGYSPYTFRAKTDGFGKLFALGKGYAFKDSLLLNMDLGYIRAQSNPSNSFVNFSRLTGSFRLDKTWRSTHKYNLRSNLDYNTTLDNNKTDPDNSFVEDSYYGRKQRYSWNNQFAIRFNDFKWINDLELTSSLSFQKDIIDEDKWIQARTATILINSLEQGSHEASFLTPSYLSNIYVEGLPFTAYHKLVSKHKFLINPNFSNNLKFGIESNFSKNYGGGAMYDLNYPPKTDITARPRAYKNIPATHTLSFFAEDDASIKMNQFRLDAVLGFRAFSMTSLADQYTMAGKIYLEPRANIRLHLPKFDVYNNPFEISFGGGYGVLKKTPTLDHLYPDLVYRDIVELNFFHNNPEFRIAQAYTDITNPVNYNLKPATNKKLEFNGDFNYKGFDLKVTWFKERMDDAFRPYSLPNEIHYTDYDNTSLSDIANLTQRPSLSDFTSQPASRFYTISTTQNGSITDKDGLEFELSTKRFNSINTRFHVNGAWYKTFYKNSLAIWEQNENIILDNKAYQVIGKYIDDNGYIREALNSNLTVDSYLPLIGLNLSASFQALWYYKRQDFPKTGIPIAYKFVSEGIERPFTEDSMADPTLKQLVEKYAKSNFYENKEPLDLQINIKASKVFKDYFRASVFVNRLFLYKPNYTSTAGASIARDKLPAYFGMELTLTL